MPGKLPFCPISFRLLRVTLRLDAVEDLMNHPSFEGDFMEVAKGLPDLERIVSRIHAKNCKVKDFLKVLKVTISVVMFHFTA
jgi:DNA mismatch repair ATPase MutS